MDSGREPTVEAVTNLVKQVQAFGTVSSEHSCKVYN